MVKQKFSTERLDAGGLITESMSQTYCKSLCLHELLHTHKKSFVLFCFDTFTSTLSISTKTDK